MPVDIGSWRQYKNKLWARLWEDLEIGYLDEDILPVLIELFLRPLSFSISSCSGRITLSDSTMPWAREETSVIFKKHKPVRLDEILEIYDKPVVRNLWLVVAGPILHVSSATLREALTVLNIARSSGFKHSGILSFSTKKGIITELRTGIRLTQLLKTPDKTIVPKECLDKLIEQANMMLIEGKRKLDKLLQELRRNRPQELDEHIILDLRKRFSYEKAKKVFGI